jgi:DNA-binding response OmpR family regulator
MGGVMARLLVVDDDDDLRDALGRYLEHLGHQVVCAADGIDALQAARRDPPDLALLDWQLGSEPSGLALVDALRDLCGRIVIMTGDQDAFARITSETRFPCLYKPFPLELLGALISGAS